jgi:hypothetical protein
MKFITVLVFASLSFAVFAQALPTPKTTKSEARSGLQAILANVNTSTGQVYYDCGGCPIPNDSGMGCMACPTAPSM